jgi:hypothetical protein
MAASSDATGYATSARVHHQALSSNLNEARKIMEKWWIDYNEASQNLSVYVARLALHPPRAQRAVARHSRLQWNRRPVILRLDDNSIPASRMH